MSNINYYVVNNKVRYTIQLSPGLTVETSTLAELLDFLYEYGGINEETSV